MSTEGGGPTEIYTYTVLIIIVSGNLEKWSINNNQRAEMWGAHIFPNVAEEDRRDHHAEEDDNCGGVEKAEPVDFGIKDMEVVVPSCSLQNCSVVSQAYGRIETDPGCV